MIRARTAEGLDNGSRTNRSRGGAGTARSGRSAAIRSASRSPARASSLQSRDLASSAGRLSTVTQIYQPRHTIAELDGPLRVTGPGVDLEAGWSGLRASIQRAPQALQRASLAVEGPSVKVRGLPLGAIAGRAQRFETHLRPSPALPEIGGRLRRRGERRGRRRARASTRSSAAAPSRSRRRSRRPSRKRESRRRGARRSSAGARPAGASSSPGSISPRARAGSRPRASSALDDQRRPAGRIELAAAGLGDVLATIMGGRLPGPAAGILGGAPAAPQPAVSAHRRTASGRGEAHAAPPHPARERTHPCRRAPGAGEAPSPALLKAQRRKSFTSLWVPSA